MIRATFDYNISLQNKARTLFLEQNPISKRASCTATVKAAFNETINSIVAHKL